MRETIILAAKNELNVEKKPVSTIPRNKGAAENNKKKRELNKLNLDLAAEFAKRNVKVSDFLEYCQSLHHDMSKTTAYRNMNPQIKQWKDLLEVDQVKYLSFFYYIDNQRNF